MFFDTAQTVGIKRRPSEERQNERFIYKADGAGHAIPPGQLAALSNCGRGAVLAGNGSAIPRETIHRAFLPLYTAILEKRAIVSSPAFPEPLLSCAAHFCSSFFDAAWWFVKGSEWLKRTAHSFYWNKVCLIKF